MNFKSIRRAAAANTITAFVLVLSGTMFAQLPSSETVSTVPVDKLAVSKIEKTTTTPHVEISTEKKKDDAADKESKPVTKPAQTTADPEWQFSIAPYLYLTAISGTVGANGRTADIDLSIGDVLSHFKAGFMGAFQARRGRLILFNDLFWAKLTEERDTRGSLYDSSKVSVNMTIINPNVGVRLVENDRGSFDVLGGVRITSVKNSLSFTTGILPGFTAEARQTWAAPVGGVHGVVNLSDKVFLSTIFDIGGGFGTNLTTQFYGGMGYRIKPKFALLGGYRFLKNDYENTDDGYVFDTNMNGIVLGARFDF